MSDEQDRPEADEPAERGPLGGERLAQARRERQISVLEVAKELHLDEPKVRALERNDFDVLGAPVFAKGHLRKYAQLVGVDEDDVFADYYAMTHTAALPPVVVGRKRIRQEFSPGPWIAVLAVLVVAAGAYWWLANRDGGSLVVAPLPQQEQGQDQDQDQEPEPEPEQPPPQTEASRPEAQRAAPPQTEPQPAVVAATEAPASALPSRAVPAVEPPAADGQVSISLLFSGDCWTEIVAADGRRLFFNMGHAGQSTSVRGKAPISALFGNVNNVSMQVDGSDYALPAAPSANGTVRVAILKP